MIGRLLMLVSLGSVGMPALPNLGLLLAAVETSRSDRLEIRAAEL